MFKEFKEFAMKGNVMDMAVGIIIGAAFGKIISSFVADVLMPPIGLLMGGVDFTDLTVELGKATLNYGVFIQTVVDFLIVAFAIFMVVKALNKFKKEEETKEKKPSEEVTLLKEIRDELKRNHQ